MHLRQAALTEKIRTDPQSLTLDETLSRLEQATLDQPNAPEPHYFIGEMLRAQGRPDDALRAYQSALRRNPDYVPALLSLADVLVELGGGSVGPDATRLYARAYELDESQVRAGMWAAMGAAQAGDQAKAEQAMRYIYARLPEDDPRRERFRGMIEAIGQGQAAPPAPAGE
ncbi:tetratricopeptide repeat protein [Hyphomonas sp.]|uniref:tetratricopeptide repeat protein n=1 Tax=Hyphomonas sp. TaxID=87 RepID=UPI00391BEE76